MHTRQDDKLFLIGEALHILNPRFQQALEHQDSTALIHLADQQIAGGAMALDINLGPAKPMAEMLPWVVNTIQQHTAIPLFLPAIGTSIKKALQIHSGRATINAVTADPVQLNGAMELARDFDADLVVLLTKPGLTHNDTSARLQTAMEVLDMADTVELPYERLYLDPILSTRTDPVTWQLTAGMPDLDPILETISLQGELSNQKAHTLLALSNGTMGLSADKRSVFQCRMLPLLVDAGLDGVICNCRDQALMQVADSLYKPEPLQMKAA